MLKLTLCYFYFYYTKTDTLLDIQLEYCTGFYIPAIFYQSVPDEGYSKNAQCAPNLVSTFLFK